jgi:hypothetical protein
VLHRRIRIGGKLNMPYSASWEVAQHDERLLDHVLHAGIIAALQWALVGAAPPAR